MLDPKNTQIGTKKLIAIRGERVVIVEHTAIGNNGSKPHIEEKVYERNGGRCYEVPPWFLTQKARQDNDPISVNGPTITVIYENKNNGKNSN